MHIQEIGDVKLLVVDPVVSAVNGDSHKNAEVRQSLQPLADLAAAQDVAVLGITHFAKNSTGWEPFERIVGSIAFAAFSRIVMVCSKQRDGDARIFCRAKSNIGADDGGWEYSLIQDTLPDHPDIDGSYVKWGQKVEGSARDILSAAEGTNVDDTGGGALGEAVRFLQDVLKDG